MNRPSERPRPSQPSGHPRPLPFLRLLHPSYQRPTRPSNPRSLFPSPSLPSSSHKPSLPSSSPQPSRQLCRALFRVAASLLLPLLFLASCDDVTCPLNNTVTSIYNFYASARDTIGIFHEGEAVSVADSITISALGQELVIVNRDYNISKLSLPVSFYAPADSLLWTFTDSKSRHGYDTVFIYKTNMHHFDDPSCPVHIWHHIDSIQFTRNIIDTIIVANADINYDGLENFKVYFRTSTKADTTDDTTDDSDDDTIDDETTDETTDDTDDDTTDDDTTTDDTPTDTTDTTTTDTPATPSDS